MVSTANNFHPQGSELHLNPLIREEDEIVTQKLSKSIGTPNAHKNRHATKKGSEDHDNPFMVSPTVMAGRNEEKVAKMMKDLNWQGKFDELTENLKVVKRKQRFYR